MTADKINLTELRANIQSYLEHGNRRNALPVDADELFALIDAVEAAHTVCAAYYGFAPMTEADDKALANEPHFGEHIDRLDQALDRFAP